MLSLPLLFIFFRRNHRKPSLRKLLYRFCSSTWFTLVAFSRCSGGAKGCNISDANLSRREVDFTIMSPMCCCIWIYETIRGFRAIAFKDDHLGQILSYDYIILFHEPRPLLIYQIISGNAKMCCKWREPWKRCDIINAVLDLKNIYFEYSKILMFNLE